MKEKETLEKLKDIDLQNTSKLDRNELKQIVKQGANIINRKLGVITNAGETTLAYEAIKKHVKERFGENAKGYKFNDPLLNSMSNKELRMYVNQILNDVKLKTLDLSYSLEYEKKIGVPSQWDKATKSAYWDVYNFLHSTIGETFKDKGSEQLMHAVEDFMLDVGSQDITKLSADDIYSLFREFLRGDPRYKNLYVAFPPLEGTLKKSEEEVKKGSVDYATDFETRRKKWDVEEIQIDLG